MMGKKAKRERRTTMTTAKPAQSEPTRKASQASAKQGPLMSCENYVKAHGNSPALKRYLLRHYGGGNKTASEWQKIVDGLRVRKVS